MRFDSSKLSVNGKKLETACSMNVRNCFNCRKSLSFSWWAYHISKRGCPFHIWLTQNIKSKIKLTEKWEKEKTQQRDYNTGLHVQLPLKSYLVLVSDTHFDIIIVKVISFYFYIFTGIWTDKKSEINFGIQEVIRTL